MTRNIILKIQLKFYGTSGSQTLMHLSILIYISCYNYYIYTSVMINHHTSIYVIVIAQVLGIYGSKLTQVRWRVVYININP